MLSPSRSRCVRQRAGATASSHHDVQKMDPCGEAATNASYDEVSARDSVMLTGGDGTILQMRRPAPNGLRVVHCPVNIGGIPATNVQALKRKGIDARLLMFRPPKLRSDVPDIVLNTPDGLWRRQLVQARALARLLPETDVFHFYFGLTLVPRRLQFPILKLARKKSVFHFLGSDIRRKTPAELGYARHANARIVGSFDAARWVPDAHVVPPGIDLSRYPVTPPPDRNGRVRVAHAPSDRRKKGTDVVIAACDEVGVELDIVEGVRHDDAVRRFAEADVIVDQLNAGWYGLFAIECMALGKPVLGFLNDDAVARTEEAFDVRVPVINVTKETLAARLQEIVAAAPTERRRIGEASRTYVERVHDPDCIADQLLEIYAGL
jgi:glycosyltransferase involved in cell wall biosynthesis